MRNSKLSDEDWTATSLYYFLFLIVIWEPFLELVRRFWFKVVVVLSVIALIVVAVIWGPDLVEGFLGMIADFNEMCEEQYKSMGMSQWLKFN